MLSSRRVFGKWILKNTSGDTVSAKIIVNAAGAWCDELAANCGAKKLSLRTTRRTAFIATVSNWNEIHHLPLVTDLGGRCYFKPETGGVLCSPMDNAEIAPGNITFDEVDIARALDGVNELTNLNCRHVKSAWAGLRTFSNDSNPICGFDPFTEDFYWLAGQGGSGIQTSIALAELACAEIIEKKLPHWASTKLQMALRPKRFSKVG